MNDPNGLVYYHGEYHLFYQSNPVGNDWGHMSWGHAISRDLVHWHQLPTAILEENGIMIFSGSVVVDWHNSSGFCVNANAIDPSCLVAIFTGHTSTRQTQNLAFSNDDGRTWSKYSGNPVLDLNVQDFRDPKVFWHAPTSKWVMVTALPTQHKLRFFGSTDLKHWDVLSDFGPNGATGGVWECPDLFELPVEGENGQSRWVLSVNLNPGGIAGGSGDQYFIGQFDGLRFITENFGKQTLWADYGKDFYASTSFSDIPPSDRRRIWLGWLDNWDYASKTPTYPWRGALSAPRELKLKRFANSIRLVQQPVNELKKLRHDHFGLVNKSSNEANRLLSSPNLRGDSLEIIAEIKLGNTRELGFKVRMGSSEETIIAFDTKASELFVDRSHSGNVGFDQKFPGRHFAPLRATNGVLRLHILVDRSSVEVFGGNGESVISDVIFPSDSSNKLQIYSVGGKAVISNLEVWKLGSSEPAR